MFICVLCMSCMLLSILTEYMLWSWLESALVLCQARLFPTILCASLIMRGSSLVIRDTSDISDRVMQQDLAYEMSCDEVQLLRRSPTPPRRRSGRGSPPRRRRSSTPPRRRRSLSRRRSPVRRRVSRSPLRARRLGSKLSTSRTPMIVSIVPVAVAHKCHVTSLQSTTEITLGLSRGQSPDGGLHMALKGEGVDGDLTA